VEVVRFWGVKCTTWQFFGEAGQSPALVRNRR
jgi:hypothetical protein